MKFTDIERKIFSGERLSRGTPKGKRGPGWFTEPSEEKRLIKNVAETSCGKRQNSKERKQKGKGKEKKVFVAKRAVKKAESKKKGFLPGKRSL